MKVQLSVILCLSLLVMPIYAQQEWTEEELADQRRLVEGQKQLMLEDYEAAMEAFSKVYDKNPNQGTALWGISRVHLANNDYDRAEKAILKAIESEPENKWFLEQYTKVLKKNRDYKKLAKTFEKLHAIDPGHREYAFKASSNYERLKDYSSALKALEGLDRKEVDPSVSYRRARIYDLSGAVKKAEKEYKKLIESDPNEMRFRHLLAQHYQANRKNDKAMEVYQQILEINPNDARASLAISNELRQSGGDVQYLTSIEKIIVSPHIDVDTKIKELIPFVQKLSVKPDPALQSALLPYADTLVALHPRDAKTHALRADVYNLSERTEEALPSYEKAIELDPSVYTVWEQLLYGLQEKKDYTRLQKRAEEALDYFPNRGRIFYFLGTALNGQYQYEKAIDELSQGAFMVGRDARLNYDIQSELARAHWNNKNNPLAKKAFEKAVNIHDGQVEILADYAALLAQMEEWDSANTYIEKAKAIDEGLDEVQFAEALMSVQAGDLTSAAEVLISLNERSANPMRMESLGDVLFLQGKVDEAVSWWQKSLDLFPQAELAQKIKKRQLNP